MTAPDALVLITAGRSSATLDRTGARLRNLVLVGNRITAPHPDDDFATAAYWGATLAPWPNRLRDGELRFNDATHRFPTNDPNTGTALHGTFDDVEFRIAQRSPSTVTMISTTTLAPPRWPSAVSISTTFTISDGALVAELRAENVGDADCPIGLGVHPYLDPGGPVDDAAISLPAHSRITTDERLLPTGATPHEPGRLALGGVVLDTTYAELVRDGHGRAIAVLHRADGVDVEVWGGPAATHLQVYTADTLPEPRRRTAIAIEPMTCAPDGVNGPDATVVAPARALTMTWGIRLPR